MISRLCITPEQEKARKYMAGDCMEVPHGTWERSMLKQMPEEKAIKKILDNTHNGAIFLFHPTSDTNVKILNRLISEWKNQGFRFGELDELVTNMTKADAN